MATSAELGLSENTTRPDYAQKDEATLRPAELLLYKYSVAIRDLYKAQGMSLGLVHQALGDPHSTFIEVIIVYVENSKDTQALPTEIDSIPILVIQGGGRVDAYLP